jgi:hypothetical protein
VCEGDYDQSEIIVDHLILAGNELEGVHAGSKVRLVLLKSKTIFVLNNEYAFA